MRLWAEVHPFNVISLVRLRGPADVETLRAAIGQVHARAGLARADALIEIAVERSGSAQRNSDTDPLVARIADELNRPFVGASEPPIRFFVLAGRDDHYIGRVYQHWIGDAYALNLLLCRTLATYLGVDQTSDAAGDIDPSPVTLRSIVARQIGVVRWLRLLAETAAEHWTMRGCYAPWSRALSDLGATPRLIDLPPAVLTRVTAAARGRGVTINDLLLACLAEAIAINTPERRQAPRRRHLALTSIVDLRPTAPTRLAHRMGLYLSYFNVICRDGSTTDFERLVSAIRARTARVKRHHGHLGSLLELAAASRLWPSLTPGTQPAYFFARKPVAGAVTNVRVPGTWLTDALRERVREWHQIVSPGPMTPLVLAATSAAGRLTCSLTTHASGYSAAQVDAIARRFRTNLVSV